MQILEYVTDESFDAACYLRANGDVEAAATSRFERRRHQFAATHFDLHGRHEARRQYRRSSLRGIQARRDQKLARLHERSPGTARRSSTRTFRFVGEKMALLQARSAAELPWPMENVSANVYDPPVADWIDERSDDLLLDLGAGLRTDYLDHVVNVEVDCLPTTDVLALGADLPFDDGTFDGAVCLAVLEHVADPFSVAAELVRVVRPGGEIIVDWPFLQPVHGYPHHYFNATPDGARHAFEQLDTVAGVELSTPAHFHPVFSLTWILGSWMQSLPAEASEAFGALTIADLVESSPHDLVRTAAWSTELPIDRQPEISAGTRLHITRR